MSQQKPSMLNEEDLINFDVYFPPFKYWSKNNLPDPEIINDLTSKEKIDTGNIYIHFPFVLSIAKFVHILSSPTSCFRMLLI